MGSSVAPVTHRGGPGSSSNHVGFVVGEMALSRVVSEYFGFPYQFSFHRLLHTCRADSGSDDCKRAGLSIYRCSIVGQVWPMCRVDSGSDDCKRAGLSIDRCSILGSIQTGSGAHPASRWSGSSVKNAGGRPPLPHTSSWQSAFINHKENTFSLRETPFIFTCESRGEIPRGFTQPLQYNADIAPQIRSRPFFCWLFAFLHSSAHTQGSHCEGSFGHVALRPSYRNELARAKFLPNKNEHLRTIWKQTNARSPGHISLRFIRLCLIDAKGFFPNLNKHVAELVNDFSCLWYAAT
jgi:hypothetical protein